MAIASALDFDIRFDLFALPYFFALEDTTDYVGQGITLTNVKGNFSIDNPVQNIHNNVSWVSPDIQPNTSREFNSVNIPYGSDGLPLAGTYTFVYTIQVSGGVQPGTYSKTVQVTFGYVRPVINIQLLSYPYTGVLTSTDITQYGISGISPLIYRTHTVQFPDLSGIDDSVSVGSYIPVSGSQYIPGVYYSTVDSEVIYDFTGFEIRDRLQGSNAITVTDANVKGNLYCCLKGIQAKLKQYKKNNEAEYQRLLPIFNQACSLMILIEEAQQFGQYTDIEDYVLQIYALTGCSANCGCGNLRYTTLNLGNTSNVTPTSDLLPGHIIMSGRQSETSQWKVCNGDLISTVTYPDYFAAVGTVFNIGGEPSGYVRLPDFRGRSPIGAGTGTGLTPRTLGVKYGAESTSNNHRHGASTIVIADHAPITFGVISLAMAPLTGNFTATPHLTIDPALGSYTPAGTIGAITPAGTIASITPAGTIAAITPAGSISQITPAGTIGSITPAGSIAVTINNFTPAGTIGAITPAGSIGAINFSNTTISGTIAEAVGHTHNVTVPAMIPTYGDAPPNIPAAPGTYPTTATIVSINLAGQPITFGGTQTPVFTGTPVTPIFTGTSGAITVNTQTFTGTPVTPVFTGTPVTPTFTGTPVTPVFTGTPVTPVFTGTPVTPVFTGTPTSFAHTHTFTLTIDPIPYSLNPSGTVTIPDKVISSHIVSGYTDYETIVIAVLHPVLCVNYIIKVS